MTERTYRGWGNTGASEPSVRDGGSADACADGGRPSGGLFAAMPDPAVRYSVGDGEPRITEANGAYVDVFGVDADVGGGLERRLRTDLGRSDPDEEMAQVDAIVEGAVRENGIRTVVEADTERGERDYLARVVPVAGDASWDGYLVLTDITAQLERTRDLIEQRDRLDEFASIVSHDLRNPLEVARIQMEAARNRGEDVHFEKVADAHRRMERIIEDVLTLARQGQVIDEVGDATLSVVAEDAWDSVSAPRATMTVDGDACLEADADRLQEVLENLFRNAVKHGDPDVTVTVGRTDEGFYVADDGPGIPQEDRDRVFEGGFSTSSDGTGLGLVIVDRIAEAHGWEVSVTESEAGGARFEFSGVKLRD